MITKEQVLNAIDIIEKYQIQERQKLKELKIKADNRSLSILGLKTMQLNSLKFNGILTIEELLAFDRCGLRKFRNLGKKGIIDINKKLKDFGIETTDFKT